MKFIESIDRKMISYIQSCQLPWFGTIMAASTFLGNGPTLAIIMACFCVIFALRHQWSLAVAFASSEFAMLGYNALKILFRRKRPDNPYAALISSSSFPSGHAAGAMTAYGLIAFALLAQLAMPYKLIAGGVLIILLPFAVGTSRIYLGAHYPSDVAGGWLLGLFGLFLLLRLWGL